MGLVAGEWTTQVSEVVGGKTGGKGTTSVGSGTNGNKLDEGAVIAADYLKKLRI
jgi:alanyl-tRNA synthetase